VKLIFLGLALILLNDASPADDPRHRLTIGPVTEEIDNSTGGCSFQLPRNYANKEGKFIFVADFSGNALINVDGVDTHLTLVKFKGPDVKQPGQLGDHSIYSYAGDALNVEVDYVVTGVCPSGSDSCKTTRYDAILTVKRSKAHKTVAAKAVCSSR
jgi:hypothetical protein